MSAGGRRDRLVRLLEPAVGEVGFDLEDVTVTPAGKHRVLRLVVDSDDGVSIDDTAELSQKVSTILDASDEMGSAAYTLEVTSPGVERSLTQPRHWRRAVGRLVRVSLTDGQVFTGRVVSADDASVALEVDGTPRAFGYAELREGKVRLEPGRRGQS